MKQKTAVIIGAGPAGLTAAYELLTRTNIKPIILEKSTYMGGISRTVNYKGNRIDIGGHRFFSKSDRVMKWWQDIMPTENEVDLARMDSTGSPRSFDTIYLRQGLGRSLRTSGAFIFSVHPERESKGSDTIMLVRNRVSRILFMRTFFDYPITLSVKLLQRLGLVRSFKIGVTYFWRLLFPFKTVENLEQFYINHFGDELYKTFFKGYTKKVWGVECKELSADWGAQRVKGVSVLKTVLDSLTRVFRKKTIDQKNVETSLITSFLYPKFGPGQMWETVAQKVQELGGEIYTSREVVALATENKNITTVQVKTLSGKTETVEADYVISTMPIKDLVHGLQVEVPTRVKELASTLPYRDFLTVGLLLNKKIDLKDNWIYIQEPDVKMGRIQIFNNWSPNMVSDPDLTWIGLEYFCNEGDELWSKSDDEMRAFAIDELEKINFIKKEDVIDGVVIKMEKTYPGYWGSYEHFDEIREYIDQFKNLFLIGRNGMHRYNNQDHSMLAAMKAVDLIAEESDVKAPIWHVNAEKEYHESK